MLLGGLLRSAERGGTGRRGLTSGQGAATVNVVDISEGAFMMVDVRARLHAAQTDTDQGRYPEALAGFLWFHEQAASEPALAGVRLSFALSSWSQLADRYPPADQAMRGTRAAAEDVVLDPIRPDAERARAFADVAALNRQLALEAWTVALYRRLSLEAPAVADLCAGAAFDAVAASGDAALALRCLGDDPEAMIHRKATVLTAALDSTDPPLHLLIGYYLRAVTRAAAVLRLNGRDTEVDRLNDLAVQAAPPAVRDQIRAALTPLPFS